MSRAKVFTASLLVAGTAIGAGMLALPVVTAQGGWWPAISMYLLCWVYSMMTGLLLLEACFWGPPEANIITLASHLLGKKGKIASWLLYLFLFYCLTIAYVAGGGGFVVSASQGALPSYGGILLFVAVFSPVIYLGTRAVDRLNFVLMIGLVASFVIFLLIGFGKVHLDFFTRKNWPVAFLALPVIFTSFSYQGVIPSLRTYFGKNAKGVRKAIIFGSTIPFFVYVIWEYLILGIIPLEGANGMLAAKQAGASAVEPLKHFADSDWVYGCGQAFAFFALTTSFLGVTLGLFDCLADGLKWPKKGGKKGALFALVFVPPTLIAMVNPTIFLRALSYAGGIGCALLLGLMPVLMVWSGRYVKGLSKTHQQVRGGKLVLLLICVFIVFELMIELINELA